MFRFLIESGVLHCLRVNKVKFGTKNIVKQSLVRMVCINAIAGAILQEERMLYSDNNSHATKESKKKS